MKLSHSLTALTLAVAALAAISLPAMEGANAAEMTARPAPSLDGGETWLNSPPLTTADLKGKVVLVDFWTYDCINCLNHLPSVRAWHDKYKDQGLVVVGVHTPEFAYERSTKNVQDAIKRLQVKHAVVQDNQFAIWRALGNDAWPAQSCGGTGWVHARSQSGGPRRTRQRALRDYGRDRMAQPAGPACDDQRRTPSASLVSSRARRVELA